MKKLFVGLLFILVCIVSLAQNDTIVTVKGNITGLAEGTEIKLVNANTGIVLGNTKAQAEKFSISTVLKEPELCWLQIGNAPQQYIYVQPGVITVAGNSAALGKLSITGSSSHTDFVTFQQMFNPLVLRLQAVVQQVNASSPGEERDSIMTIYNRVNDSIQMQIDVFLQPRKNSYVSPFILFVTYQFNDDPLLMEKRYNLLDSVIRNSLIGKQLSDYIAYNKVGAVGTEALDFTQPDTTGKPVALSSFRGKYVLVDFWASWCGPCRQENPNVVANYHKFKDKNFTVLGVSLDKPGQKSKWIEAIHKDKLTWTHVSDLQYWNNAAAQLYHVTGIPFSLLLDPNGKIVGRNLRGPELEKKLCELIGCN